MTSPHRKERGVVKRLLRRQQLDEVGVAQPQPAEQVGRAAGLRSTRHNIYISVGRLPQYVRSLQVAGVARMANRAQTRAGPHRAV